MVTAYAPLDRFRNLGELVFGPRAGVGELSLAETLEIRAGRWQAFFLGTETIDGMVDAGEAPEDANEQLLLVHVEAGLLSDLGALEKLAELRLNGARFVVADEPLWELLTTEDGFYDHLDGVEGVLEIGRGIQVLLDGDGTAHVWGSASRDTIFVDLR